MAGDDIGVEELAVLTEAADAVAVSVARWDGLGGIDVVDVMPDQVALGHPALAAACGRFTARWERGVTLMVADAAEVSTRLTLTARQYQGVDRSAGDLLQDIVAQDSRRAQGVLDQLFGWGSGS